MNGYDPEFLQFPVPFPGFDGDVELLDYTHFSILMSRSRRLAVATAVNLDGARLLDLDRSGIDWRFDPRLPEADQVGDELYRANDLDRGHLVRRRDPVWGEPQEAAQANADTFFFTNAAPQAAAFNQGKELWLGLEDYLLDNAEMGDRKLTVLTGPVLDDDDPVYRGVAIPLAFWKVVGFLDGGELAATAYLLDQTPVFPDLPTAMQDDDPPPLGPYRTFQVPVADVATVTGLDVGPLLAADRLTPTPAVGAPAAGAFTRRRPLAALTDVMR